MIPDDPPLESSPPKEKIELNEPSITNEEIRENRPLSPTCSSTDEYSDSDPELPATQLSDESSDESNLRYEQPPLDWNDMDPNQRLIWLREHPLPNKNPFKLILTYAQDLTRRQIDRIKRLKRPKLFYSQPSKNDRKIFGGIVPFGKVWRTGANEATEITFTQKVKIGGKIVNPGTYTIFTVPGEKTWSLILNSDLGMWGDYDYDAKKDILKVEAIPSASESVQELFTVKFDKTANGCNMSMMWDNVLVVIPIDSKI
jgi:hypothetical protein